MRLVEGMVSKHWYDARNRYVVEHESGLFDCCSFQISISSIPQSPVSSLSSHEKTLREIEQIVVLVMWENINIHHSEDRIIMYIVIS